MALKIGKSEAVSLLQECGYETAKEFSIARLKKKLEALPKSITEENKPEAKANKKLLKQLVEEMEGDGEIVVEGPDGDSEEAAPAEKKSAKKEKKAPPKEEVEEEDDEEESDEEADDEEESEEEDEKEAEESDDEDEESDDEEDEEEDAKPKKSAKKEKEADKKKAKRGPPASAGGEGKPGIIQSIVEFLQEGSEAKPLTKAKIVEKLAARFKDRSADAMKKTVNVQVPNRIKNDKKLNVEKKELKDGGMGYWINPDKVEGKSKKAKSKKEED